MKYYVYDTTLKDPMQLFDSVPQVVKHLEGTVQRRFGISRKQYMQNLIDLGYGYDDDQGVTFTQSLTEFFNIGVYEQGRPMKTNIHEAHRNLKYRSEYGH